MPTQLFPAPSGQHDISYDDAKQLIDDYVSIVPAGDRNQPGIMGGIFDIEAIKDIINQEGVYGLRYYYGFDAANKQRNIILVGTDEYGNDTNFTGMLKERAYMNPPFIGSII
jgi:hypothetical protein